MTRSDFFILCVQTAVLKMQHSQVSAQQALGVLSEAMRVPEQALPDDIAKGAFEFAQGQVGVGFFGKKTKPEWLTAFENQVADCTIIRINTQAGSGVNVWWAQAEQAFLDSREGNGPVVPEECVSLLVEQSTEITVTGETARLFKQWVDNISGFEEEPFIFEKQ